jgi:hypothetical protein
MSITYSRDFLKYVRLFKKKKKRNMTKKELANYFKNKYSLNSVFNVNVLKIRNSYVPFSEESLFVNSLDSKDNLIVIFPKYNLLFFGGEYNMKRISVVNTYYKGDFKEKVNYIYIKDENNINHRSSNIVFIDIPLESIFYTNADEKEMSLLEQITKYHN